MGTVVENKTGEDVGNLKEIFSITHISCSPLINYTKILLWEELVLKKKIHQQTSLHAVWIIPGWKWGR